MESKLNLFKLISNTFSTIDDRLINHGERVAYILWKMLTLQNKYSRKQIREFAFLALLHDIGAYKTEIIDQIVDFESKDSTDHSIYGHLFFLEMSPLSHLADIILYHHIPYQLRSQKDNLVNDLSSMLFLADRIDIYLKYTSPEIDDSFFNEYRGILFSPEHLDLFIAAEKQFGITNQIATNRYKEELDTFSNQYQWEQWPVEQNLEMLAYAIDFRSEQTMLHTFTTTSVAKEIGLHLNCSDEQLEKISYGALLHDLGKIKTPLSILEKAGKLNSEEMDIMRKHIIYTEQILTDSVPPDVVKMAIRHHEKLDGSGYPYGLKANDLTINERIIAVADIVSALVGNRSYKKSFPKEKVLTILTEMVDNNKICPTIVHIVQQHYDEIIDVTREQAQQVISLYSSIVENFFVIRDHFHATHHS